MDFTQPQPPRSINGFPITFRQVVIDGQDYWVPRGLSRYPQLPGWRLCVAHQDGTEQSYVKDDSGKPVQSLELAYERLISTFEGTLSPFVVDKRSRLPGLGRDPLLDTGFTGVLISRQASKGQKRIVVTVGLTTPTKQGNVEGRRMYVGCISESVFLSTPRAMERHLSTLLGKAVAIRRYYNRLRSRGHSIHKPIPFADVPDDILAQPHTLPNLDLAEIFDSYCVPSSQTGRFTTQGDPGALAARMQSWDLRQKNPAVYLEGRNVKFREVNVEGHTLYLPRGLYRARNEWRVRVTHTEGVFSDSMRDTGDLHENLNQAWKYLVSLFRSLPSPGERATPVKAPILDTGVGRVFIQPMRRVSKLKGTVVWSFAVKCRPEHLTRGRSITVMGGKLEDLTDKALADALCKATAMIRYSEHLNSISPSLELAVVDQSTKIPEEFWPPEPVCTVNTDDLNYYVEQQPDEQC